MDELLDITDENGVTVGEAPRSEAHRLGLWHRIFHAWITTDDPSPRLLLQQRSLATELNAGRWDISVAGHYLAGEETRDGVREIDEELGFRPAPDRITRVGCFPLRCIDGLQVTNELCDVFLVRDGLALSDYRLQADEVARVGYVPMADLGRLLEDPRESVEIDSVEWIEGRATRSPISIGAESFGDCKAAMLRAVYPHVISALGEVGATTQRPFR